MTNAAVALLVGTGLTSLTACSPGVVCPAIGYVSSAAITLAHPQPGLTLEVCDGEGCALGADRGPIGDTYAEEGSLLEVTGSSQGGWQVTFGAGGDSTIGYRLMDGAGSVVDEGYVSVDWIRVDGSAQCGGNREATVELPV